MVKGFAFRISGFNQLITENQHLFPSCSALPFDLGLEICYLGFLKYSFHTIHSAKMTT